MNSSFRPFESSLILEPLEARRLLAAGALDPTFGTGGKVKVDFPTITNIPTQAALQPSGKIVLLQGLFENQLQLARYTSNGKLDTTFGIGGTVPIPFEAGAMAIRSDGKIVFAANSPFAGDRNTVLLARYTIDGKIDTTFGGGDGQVTQALFGRAAAYLKTITRLLIRPDNRILVAGSIRITSAENNSDFALSSFTQAGDIDSSFGATSAGATITNIGGDDTLNDAAFAPGGKIVAVGTIYKADLAPPPSSEDFAVAQFDDTGHPDSAFGGGDGIVTTNFEDFSKSHPEQPQPVNSFDSATSLAVESDGKITVAGASFDPIVSPLGAPISLAMARYLPNGNLDATFSPGGVAGSGKFIDTFGTTPLNDQVALSADGKIVIGASDSSFGFGLLRLTHGGILDTTFGTGGKMVTNIDQSIDDVGDMLLQPDGKIILAGQSVPSSLFGPGQPASAILARYLSDSAQTPFSGKPIDVFLGETIQFENFDNGGEGVAFHDTDTANLGGAYRNTAVDIQSIPTDGNTLAFTKAGEWTEYSIIAGDHAYCDATLTYASLKGGGKFHLEIDGRNVTGAITLASTGGWQIYKSIDLPHIEMTPGQHILRLALDANDATGFVGNFDSVHIDQELENMQIPYNPSHSPWSPNQIIQAEDFNTGGESFAYHDAELTNLGGAYRPGEGVDIEPATDTGGGFDVGFTKAGEFLSYTINTPQAGLFGLDVRLASLRAGGQFHIEIDGKNVASFNVPATGGWQTYTTLSTSKNISLTTGQHSLKIVMNKNNSVGFVANFNWLKLRS